MEGLIALIIFIYIPGVVVLIRNIFQDMYFWQVKEYRLDRVISSIRFREEPTHRNKLINILQYGLFISFIIFFISPTNVLLILPALTFGSYWLESLNVLQVIMLRRLVRPKKSLRNLLIGVFSLILLLAPIIIPVNLVIDLYKSDQITKTSTTTNSEQIKFSDFLLQKHESSNQTTEIDAIPLVLAVAMVACFFVLSADLVTSLIVSLMAIITEPLAQAKRRALIKKAKQKISRHKKFKVVAITGSYGKTTTKEMLYELIKDNYKTAKTRENYNSPVGIAQEVLLNLENDTEIFIAEMGAYKKGEISRSCEILRPDISIVTAVAPQHLSLFGSLENIVKAKYEIIEKLKPEGLAIFNGNNQYCLQMATKSKNRELIYFTIENTIDKPAENNNERETLLETIDKQITAGKISGRITASGIYNKASGYKFDLTYNKSTLPVTIHVTGQHNISNVLAAIGAALELGMDFKSIVAKLQTMKLPQVYLVWRKGIKNTKILDDGYNSNIDGFKEAIKIVAKEAKEREAENANNVIVVTKGLIELKDMKKSLYSGLKDLINTNVDCLISSDADLLDLIEKPIPGKKSEKELENKCKPVLANSPEEFFNAILENSSEGDIILLEGALAPKLLSEIIVH